MGWNRVGGPREGPCRDRPCAGALTVGPSIDPCPEISTEVPGWEGPAGHGVQRARWMVNGLTWRRVKRWAVHGVWACRPGEAMAKHSRKRETEEPRVFTSCYGRGKPKDLSQVRCRSWVNSLELSGPRERTDSAKTLAVAATMAACCPSEASLAWSPTCGSS